MTGHWHVWTETRGEAERFRDKWQGIDSKNRAEIEEHTLKPNRRSFAAFLNKHGAQTQ